jgi:isopentenyl diphosphate isomerase/L-lactate dehydrogenase-like FMN-dependent dehydrogenase
LIAEEMRVAMTLIGVRTVKEITRDNLVKAAELLREIEDQRGASAGVRNAA